MRPGSQGLSPVAGTYVHSSCLELKPTAGSIRADSMIGSGAGELALASGVTRNIVIDVEHGYRGLLYERVVDIADALGVPVSSLFSDQ